MKCQEIVALPCGCVLAVLTHGGKSLTSEKIGKCEAHR